MFPRLVLQSFLRQKRRKLLAGAAIALGAAILTATLAVQNDIGDRLNLELRSLGANIILRPEAQLVDVRVGDVHIKPLAADPFLHEADLIKMKDTFWGHNILAYSPFLESNVSVGDVTSPLLGTYFAKSIPFHDDSFVTGVRKTHPWWHVRGEWPRDDSSEALVGEKLAATSHLAIGQTISLRDGGTLRVTGIVSTGDDPDNAVIAPLAAVQRAAGTSGAVSYALVSALTKPEDDFGRRDPATMSGPILERWMCSPYPNSIAHQIAAAIPGSHAEQVRRVSQNEGAILQRVSGLFLLVTIAALLAATLTVGASMASSLFERRREVGVMRSLGASRALIAALFIGEASVLALFGGAVGFFLGELLGRDIGQAIFHSSIRASYLLLPLVLLASVLVTFAGSAISIRRSLNAHPSLALRGDA